MFSAFFFHLLSMCSKHIPSGKKCMDKWIYVFNAQYFKRTCCCLNFRKKEDCVSKNMLDFMYGFSDIYETAFWNVCCLCVVLSSNYWSVSRIKSYALIWTIQNHYIGPKTKMSYQICGTQSEAFRTDKLPARNVHTWIWWAQAWKQFAALERRRYSVRTATSFCYRVASCNMWTIYITWIFTHNMYTNRCCIVRKKIRLLWWLWLY